MDPDVRRELRRLHVNLGHVSTVGLLRRLRRAGARPEVIAAAKDLPCDACGDAIRAQHPRPTRSPGTYVFNYMLWADILTAYDCHGTPYWFLNVLCDGTGFGVCYCIGQARGSAFSFAGPPLLHPHMDQLDRLAARHHGRPRQGVHG